MYEHDNYTPPVQSADTLFHFVSKLDYLSQIIERFAFVPRYCVENIDYLNINLKQSAYPMICFCDINLHRYMITFTFMVVMDMELHLKKDGE